MGSSNEVVIILVTWREPYSGKKDLSSIKKVMAVSSTILVGFSLANVNCK